VHAVGLYLTFSLTQYDLPPSRSPALGRRKLGTEDPDEEERDSFAEQVSVG